MSLAVADDFVISRFRAACRWAGVADEDLQPLLSRCRVPRLVALREAVTWHMRHPDQSGRHCSYPQIAVAFGRPTGHSSFIYAHRRYVAAHPDAPVVVIPAPRLLALGGARA